MASSVSINPNNWQRVALNLTIQVTDGTIAGIPIDQLPSCKGLISIPVRTSFGSTRLYHVEFYDGTPKIAGRHSWGKFFDDQGRCFTPRMANGVMRYHQSNLTIFDKIACHTGETGRQLLKYLSVEILKSHYLVNRLNAYKSDGSDVTCGGMLVYRD